MHKRHRFLPLIAALGIALPFIASPANASTPDWNRRIVSASVVPPSSPGEAWALACRFSVVSLTDLAAGRDLSTRVVTTVNGVVVDRQDKPITGLSPNDCGSAPCPPGTDTTCDQSVYGSWCAKTGSVTLVQCSATVYAQTVSDCPAPPTNPGFAAGDVVTFRVEPVPGAVAEQAGDDDQVSIVVDGATRIEAVSRGSIRMIYR